MKRDSRHRPFKTLNIAIITFAILLILLLALFNSRDAAEKRYVLLSFDVEPVDGNESVTELIQMLDSKGVEATFFVTGEYAEQYPDVLKLMSRHEIGNHGHSHKAFTRMNSSEKRDEIRKTNRILEGATGRDVAGFRAPYNLVDTETLQILEQEGMKYDASIVSGWGLFFPSVKGMDIGEIPVSSIFGVPLEDVAWLHYLRMPSVYFYILKNKEGDIESYLFHPHHIVQYKKELQSFINYLNESNVIFISHSRLTEEQHVGG